MTDAPQSNEAVRVFYSYSHKDEKLRDTLQEHLSLLKRDGVISEWHDRGIGAGREWAGEIDEHLKSADIILLLVSSSFIASDYCYDVELKLALGMHEAGKARVIPVILRPCKWEKAPFGKLNALPKNAKAVTKWSNRDDAFTDIADGIGLVAEELKSKRREADAPAALAENPQPPAASSPSALLIPRPPVVGFVARRDKEGRDIVGLLKGELSPDKNQLVALWGPGGAGKTTLAAEVVRATEGVFKGRVAWASPLRRADFTSATLLDEIATQLGREDLRRLGPDPKAAQVAALISEAPTLVILDNFETVAEEEQTRCLDFLAQSAACPVLITTRAFINRDDVTNVELAAMELDEAREFLRRLIERTPKKQNFKSLDHDDLIRKCEANPLLLQWVVRQIVLSKTPETAIDYLSKGEGDAAERVFTRSFNLPQLGDDGRAALLALSLFTPSASREALAEVAGFGDDLRRLDQAVEALSSLWLVETTEGNQRLFLRGLTRDLAKSSASGDRRADELRRRYVVHFLRYAAEHEQQTPENLDALETDTDNLLGAADTAFSMRDWKSVMQIRAALNGFLYLRGYWDEAARTGEVAEAAARESGDEERATHFAIDVATVRRNRGEHEEAERIYNKALKIFSRLGNDLRVAVCLDRLGKIAQTQGRTEEAHRLYLESLSISKRLGVEKSVARTLSNVGKLAQEQKDYDEAFRCYRESLEITRRLPDPQGIAITLRQLGLIAKSKGELSEARQLFGESLDISRRLGDQNGIAMTLRSIGQLEKELGNKTEAVKLFHEALRIYERLGSPSGKKVRDYLTKLESGSG
ncbi:MAG TPA: tetratricopeptide repeat protein [Pyrinomonadaceae bacterium]|jgi:tetratricopeptide (TPR) repeat protein|nr:tetratricopeptide repeat protein [Pyrinomonadaceae bacterium]